MCPKMYSGAFETRPVNHQLLWVWYFSGMRRAVIVTAMYDRQSDVAAAMHDGFASHPPDELFCRGHPSVAFLDRRGLIARPPARHSPGKFFALARDRAHACDGAE
jgi:hypothetical protein